MKRSCPEAELRPRPAAAEAAADFKLRPVVRFATQDVFNLPISEAFLVLDVRGPALYRASHLHSAWCAEEALGASLLLPPACMDGSDPSGVVRDRLLNLLDFIGDENPPEQLDTVVCPPSPPPARTHALARAWLLERVRWVLRSAGFMTSPGWLQLGCTHDRRWPGRGPYGADRGRGREYLK